MQEEMGEALEGPEVAEIIAESFIRVRFRGGRFDDVDGMPLEALPELSVLNDLLVTLGEELWRQKVGKQRIHDDSYPDPPRLSIKRFENASSIPVIERQVTDIPEAEDGFDPYEASRDLVEATFKEIVSSNKLPASFPDKYSQKLRRFGKTLKTNEWAAFQTRDESGDWVENAFSPTVRSTFWESYDLLAESDEVIVGKVENLGRSKDEGLNFIFRRANQQALTGQLPDRQLWNDLHAALGKADRYPYCRLHVHAEKDAMGRLRRICSVERVEVMETSVEGWHERFEELADSAFTNEIGAEPVETESLERAAAIIAKAMERNLEVPVVFPSHEGGVSLIWQTESDRTTVYIEPGEPYEVENVPEGPIEPYTSLDVAEVIESVRGYVK